MESNGRRTEIPFTPAQRTPPFAKWNIETGIAEWQALLGEIDGYVTLNAQGHVIHGDETILDSDFAFFAEDDRKTP